ncbi:MAG: undecaprenyl/decaprenyl-phosphate alpha-N-acetylglucosaminyl 1-phosphate transferase [Mongoliibacter sp.]|nr:MAG: undecaprenyl/decaprenyl-phosphate alpha-N-acetylglucosaminyl 1-phosphate transferase [Mongoliibacter sp.]
MYPILIKLLVKMKMTDTPGGRKIHTSYIPSMGGIGFVIATFIAVFIWFPYGDLVEIRYLLAAFGLMFFVGLRDDMVNLSAFQKLGAQVVAALMVIIMADVRITGLYGLFGVYDLPLYTSYALTLVTIIGLTNAFNLIDGLDGLAGSISLVSFAFLGWWFYDVGYDAYAYFAFAILGGILSFLIFNWHPAKIFMGDTGSLSIGFSLAILAVLFIDIDGTMSGVNGVKFAAPIATGVALLIVPIYDTLRVFLKRAAKGKSPMSPDKSHVHHFLLRMGLRHDQVTLLLIGVKLFFIGLIFLAKDLGDAVMLPAVLVLAVLIGLRLDTFTLKRVKKISAESPPVLVKKVQKVKPVIQPKVLRNMKVNDN